VLKDGLALFKSDRSALFTAPPAQKFDMLLKLQIAAVHSGGRRTMAIESLP